MLDVLTGSFKSAINKIRFKDDINSLKKATAELKKSLLKADVHHKTTKDLVNNIEITTKLQGIGQESCFKKIEKKLKKFFKEARKKRFLF